MKLLLDQNLPSRLATVLSERFPGTNHVRVLGLADALDQDIWQFAKREGFSILSKDSDFYDIGLLKGWPPKIVWLQCGNISNQALSELLLNNQEAIAEFLQQDEDGCLEIG